jgi:hypothetical protein
MVDKARTRSARPRQRHIEDVARDLRAEFRREVMELREEVGELVAEVHKLIEREKAQPTRRPRHSWRRSTHARSTWHERRPLNRARNRRGTARA